jgi:hypothetical protein
MRPGSTVQKHGIGASDGHVEGSDICLAVLKGDVAAVDTAVHGSACRVGGRLRDGVVAVGELELDNVADCGGDGVGDESILGAADDYGYDLAGATEWVGLFLVSEVKMKWGVGRTLDVRQSVDSLESRSRECVCRGDKGE